VKPVSTKGLDLDAIEARCRLEHGPLGITIFHHDYIPKDGLK